MPPEPMTPLDIAAARMQADPADVTARLRFHAELADTELFVLAAEEPRGDTLEPQVFATGDGPLVLAFDSEMRLAEFAGGVAVPYAALPGRVLVAMLTQEDAKADEAARLGLLVNAGGAQAELLPPEALSWLARTLAAIAPSEAEGVPERFAPPALPPEALALLRPALERRLSGMPGLSAAVLAGVVWQGGGQGHVLALAGVAEPVRAPLARAVAEALELSGLEAGALDVIFPAPGDLAVIAAVGLALSPAPWQPPADGGPQVAGSNPGMDPARPPKLR